MAPCDSYRRLTIFLSCTVLVSNLAAIHLYRRMPDDPLHVGWHLSIYSYFAMTLAALGLVGAKKGNATLVAIFSNYLLIDTLISVIPRIIVIILFPSIRSTICSTDTIHAWLETQTNSTAIATDDAVRSQMIGQCRTVVGVLQGLMALMALGFTVIQMLLALRVSAYARMLCRREDAEEQKIDLSHGDSAIDNAWETGAAEKRGSQDA